MKVAILSESAADEAALRILLEGLLKAPVESAEQYPLRHRGVDAAFRQLRPVLCHLYYHTDADALAVALDSDRTATHRAGYREQKECDSRCRLCKMREIVRQTKAELRPREGRRPLHTALGLAVPQIEAWYLVSVDKWVGEAGCASGLSSGRRPSTARELKEKVYECSRPSLQHETKCAQRAAHRLVEEEKLDLVEQLFPGGFGALAEDVRHWAT